MGRQDTTTIWRHFVAHTRITAGYFYPAKSLSIWQAALGADDLYCRASSPQPPGNLPWPSIQFQGWCCRELREAAGSWERQPPPLLTKSLWPWTLMVSTPWQLQPHRARVTCSHKVPFYCDFTIATDGEGPHHTRLTLAQKERSTVMVTWHRKVIWPYPICLWWQCCSW